MFVVRVSGWAGGCGFVWFRFWGVVYRLAFVWRACGVRFEVGI